MPKLRSLDLGLIWSGCFCCYRGYMTSNNVNTDFFFFFFTLVVTVVTEAAGGAPEEADGGL